MCDYRTVPRIQTEFPIVCVCVCVCVRCVCFSAGGGHRALILPEPNQKITTEVPNNRRQYYIHLKHDFRSEHFLSSLQFKHLGGCTRKNSWAHVHSSQPPHDQLVLSRVARKSSLPHNFGIPDLFAVQAPQTVVLEPSFIKRFSRFAFAALFLALSAF